VAQLQDKEVNVEHVISSLLKRYEGGALSRRELVRGLAMLAAAGGTASAAGFESSTLNHVSILVSDVPRSAAFYQRVFNLSVLDEDKAAPRIRLRLGKSSHLTIRRRNPAGTIDHFAIGIDHFNKEAVIKDLKQRGATPQEGGDAGLHVKDPDGFDVQLIANEPG
jgi:catechol 2,3-dioxygenase-like lactoylglutathione lyase family enzyme